VQMSSGGVAVTGANGFLASHIVLQLLEQGYTVHATVRNKSDEPKVRHLTAMAARFPDRLVLFNADLLKADSFDAAFRGCRAVLHVAAPVVMTSGNPQRDVVDPTVRGVQHVIESVCHNADTIEKFIYTSSIETVLRDHGTMASEDAWNDRASLDYAYSLAKVLAEKAVVSAFETVGQLMRVRLVRLLPGWIAGPLLNPNPPVPISLQVFLGLGSGEYYPLCPNFFVQVVDVRDCAAAHVRAIEREFPHNSSRIVVASDIVLSMTDVAKMSKSLFPHLSFGTLQMPDAFIWMASLWDERLSRGFLRENLGKKLCAGNERSKRLLGIAYRPAEETLRDAIDSLVTQRVLLPKWSKVMLGTSAGVLLLLLIVAIWFLLLR
jgi:nucleoside-diphosphate-sugar epimerase